MSAKKNKLRLDILLVEKGFFESRNRARSEIMMGNVLIGETAVTKPGTAVPIDAEIRIKDKMPYVGRGAYKLIHALDHFQINPQDKIAIDIGSSTGGFTEVLLERGASLVYAVDVGTNQLDWKLRSDDRVRVMENTNVRDLIPEMFDPLPEIAVMDLSFISLTRAFQPVMNCLKTGYCIIALIKPQFELDSSLVSDRGFVKPEHRSKALSRVFDFAESIGLKHSETIESPITGAKSGNVEYLAVFFSDLH